MLLYVGPDQVMPFASYLATLVGLLLIFWHKVVAACRWIWTKLKNSAG